MEHFKYNRGFTLIEMIVVLAIIVIVTAVVITSQSSFNKTLILANTAYDIALSLRAAETYGLGSRTANATANAGYGLHFSAATPATFTFFADTYPSSSLSTCHINSGAPSDRPGNCAYDASENEQVTDYTIGNGITISDFCIDDNCAIPELDIVFTRPNPDPIINGVRGASACIALTSQEGGERFVSVGASGSITANAAPCSP